MTFNITGLDKLQRDLADATKALEGLDGEIGTVKFNSTDPASIEAAIQKAERLVDERVGFYASNPIIRPMAESIKESFRMGILDQAVAERLKNDQP